MALKGTESKNKIIKVLKDVFKGAFVSDKNLIIPLNENGEIVQIKVSLTASKVNIESENNHINSTGEYTDEELETLERLKNELKKELGLSE